jgi:beta-phosphoglucomutase-like phosphatase (HAD superfamily)
MLDTVLFEFEGVLADTTDARRDALIAALHADGLLLSAVEYREHCAGLGLEDAARSALSLRGIRGDETAVALTTARAERAFRAYVGKGVTLAEGAREALERLHVVARLGIVSRTGRDEIALLLALARLEHLFTCVVAAEDAFPPKPAPTPHRTALARLTRQRPVAVRGVVVALEDSLPGIRAARSAGIRCVAVGDLPAHVVMEADGWITSLRGLTPDALDAIVSASGERIR